MLAVLQKIFRAKPKSPKPEFRRTENGVLCEYDGEIYMNDHAYFTTDWRDPNGRTAEAGLRLFLGEEFEAWKFRQRQYGDDLV